MAAFLQVNLGQLIPLGSPSSFCSWRKPVRISGMGFLQAGCPSSHPAISVIMLEGTLSTNPASGFTSFSLYPQLDS